MKKGKIIFLRAVTLLTGAGFIAVGVMLQEYKTVLIKAIKVCLECIGIG